MFAAGQLSPWTCPTPGPHRSTCWRQCHPAAAGEKCYVCKQPLQHVQLWPWVCRLCVRACQCQNELGWRQHAGGGHCYPAACCCPSSVPNRHAFVSSAVLLHDVLTSPACLPCPAASGACLSTWQRWQSSCSSCLWAPSPRSTPSSSWPWRHPQTGHEQQDSTWSRGTGWPAQHQQQTQ